MSNDYSLNPQAQLYLKVAHSAQRHPAREDEAAAADCYRAAIDGTDDVQGLLAIAGDMQVQVDRQVEADWEYNVPWAQAPDRLELTNAALVKAVGLAKDRSEVQQILKASHDDHDFEALSAAQDKLSHVPGSPADSGKPRIGDPHQVPWNGDFGQVSNKTTSDEVAKLGRQLGPEARAHVKLAREAFKDDQPAVTADEYRKAIDRTNDVAGLVGIADQAEALADFEPPLDPAASRSWAVDPARKALTEQALTKAVGLAQDQAQLTLVLAAAGRDEAYGSARAAIARMPQVPAPPAPSQPPKNRLWWNPTTWF